MKVVKACFEEPEPLSPTGLNLPLKNVIQEKLSEALLN